MKKELKDAVLKKRSSLLKKEARDKSQRIMRKLFSTIEYKKAKNILFYISFNNEVDTCRMVSEALCNKKIIVPITDKKNKKLILSELKCFNDLGKGCYGILEPKKGKIKNFNKNKIELIIVPGVVFDAEGYRIGYGHGYYDRFLKKINRNIPLIGLAYDFQVVEKVPRESHDIPVNVIITDKKMIRVNK